MKKILKFIMAISLASISMSAFADPFITCPTSLRYVCEEEDPACPNSKSKCTLTSGADAAWIFLAPAKPLKANKNPDKTSCSILDKGEYEDHYMMSLYGHFEGAGVIAYCMYGSLSGHISALYTPQYKKGKGQWIYSQGYYACNNANSCQYIHI